MRATLLMTGLTRSAVSLRGTELWEGPTGWSRRTALPGGDGCAAAAGESRSAWVRADERGGAADELGHTDAAFLGNAVKTLEECAWVAARAHDCCRHVPDLTRRRRNCTLPAYYESSAVKHVGPAGKRGLLLTPRRQV